LTEAGRSAVIYGVRGWMGAARVLYAALIAVLSQTFLGVTQLLSQVTQSRLKSSSTSQIKYLSQRRPKIEFFGGNPPPCFKDYLHIEDSS
jgi:hypothetical protein